MVKEWQGLLPIYFLPITYNGNISGVGRVYWRIYSLRVEQYIQRREEASLDILHNPSGVYYPIYPAHATPIILSQWMERDVKLLFFYFSYLSIFSGYVHKTASIYTYNKDPREIKRWICGNFMGTFSPFTYLFSRLCPSISIFDQQ